MLFFPILIIAREIEDDVQSDEKGDEDTDEEEEKEEDTAIHKVEEEAFGAHWQKNEPIPASIELKGEYLAQLAGRLLLRSLT
jgi:hypothetical protein